MQQGLILEILWLIEAKPIIDWTAGLVKVEENGMVYILHVTVGVRIILAELRERESQREISISLAPLHSSKQCKEIQGESRLIWD